MKRRLWTVNRVAEYLQVHPATIYRLIKQGELRRAYYRPGPPWCTNRRYILAWCQRHTVKPPPPPPLPKPEPQLTQSGRPRRKPLPPDTIISTCRFCHQPIPFSDYTGTRARPHPWFHTRCRKLALASASNDYAIVNLVYGTNNQERFRISEKRVVVESTGSLAGESPSSRPPGGYVRAYIRAWYAGGPLPERPRDYVRRMARLKAESGPVVVSSCGQTPESDPPGRSECADKPHTP